MAIPYRTAAKSLKKAVVKHKKPVATTAKVVPMPNHAPLFTPPGMNAADMVDDGITKATKQTTGKK